VTPRFGSLPIILFLSACATAFFANEAFADEAGLRSFVSANCNGCHNEKVSSAGINFSAYSDTKTFSDNRAIWERVLAKVKAGEMPPPGMPKPPAADIAAVSSWLESEFARQDAAVKPDAGRVAARRLNRAEYNNTVRDLLGVNIHPADDFPADQAAFGFDDISDALNMS
jgi:mono/diheme cytochrome c family protein